MNDEGKPIRGYRKRMHAIWWERQQLEVTEQRLCDQARMIRVNGWLIELELEQIKRRVLTENDEAIDEDVHDVEEEAGVSAGIKVSTNEDDRVFVGHNDDLNDEEIETLNKLNKINDEHTDEELVGFKRVERKILKQWVQKINKILPKIKTDNLTSTNNLIKACTILVGKEAV